MKLSKKFIDEIRDFKTIFCLISGGYHSTTIGLLLKDYNFKNVILLHNKTFLEMKSSMNTIKKLQNITKYEYKEIIPELEEETTWDILRRSFLKIPEVREDIKNNRYDRTKFECCNKLKKFSAKKFYNDLPNKDNFIVINSICPYESWLRNMHLHELREKNTFIRLHKKFGKIWFGYPFRDERSEKPFKKYLSFKGFGNIKHSGCSICPIVIAFKMYNSPNYYLSSKASIRAGLPCFQNTIEKFIYSN